METLGCGSFAVPSFLPSYPSNPNRGLMYTIHTPLTGEWDRLMTMAAATARRISRTPIFPSRAVLRNYGLTVKEMEFESFPLQVGDVVVVPPIELVDVPPVGGLSTRICNVPDCAMSAAGIVAVN